MILRQGEDEVGLVGSVCRRITREAWMAVHCPSQSVIVMVRLRIWSLVEQRMGFKSQTGITLLAFGLWLLAFPPVGSEASISGTS